MRDDFFKPTRFRFPSEKNKFIFAGAKSRTIETELSAVIIWASFTKTINYYIATFLFAQEKAAP